MDVNAWGKQDFLWACGFFFVGFVSGVCLCGNIELRRHVITAFGNLKDCVLRRAMTAYRLSIGRMSIVKMKDKSRPQEICPSDLP
ncbi:hypothetical protein V8C43DRAFT_281892 [Trichoderma afarasin]